MAQDFQALGFVSPKNLPYQNVELAIGSNEPYGTSTPKILATRGWVLPAKKNMPNFFVAWNGWIYRAQSVGGDADWRSDARALIERASRNYPENRLGKVDFRTIGKALPWRYEGDIWDDEVTLSFDALTPLKAVMLELLGEDELAHQALTVCKRLDRHRWDYTQRNPADKQQETVARFEVAGDWIWPGVNRVTRAIRQGDDGTALQTLRLLSRARNIVSKDYKPQNDKLLVDQERRRVQKAAPSSHYGIDFLLWDLQNAGLVPLLPADKAISTNSYWSREQRIQALVLRGDAAIEPLLQTFAYDRRLTRFFYIDWHGPPPYPIYDSVSDLALEALQHILHTDYLDELANLRSDIQRKSEGEDSSVPSLTYEEADALAKVQLATNIRADWEKIRTIPPAERPKGDSSRPYPKSKPNSR